MPLLFSIASRCHAGKVRGRGCRRGRTGAQGEEVVAGLDRREARAGHHHRAGVVEALDGGAHGRLLQRGSGTKGRGPEMGVGCAPSGLPGYACSVNSAAEAPGCAVQAGKEVEACTVTMWWQPGIGCIQASCWWRPQRQLPQKAHHRACIKHRGTCCKVHIIEPLSHQLKDGLGGGVPRVDRLLVLDERQPQHAACSVARAGEQNQLYDSHRKLAGSWGGGGRGTPKGDQRLSRALAKGGKAGQEGGAHRLPGAPVLDIAKRPDSARQGTTACRAGHSAHRWPPKRTSGSSG